MLKYKYGMSKLDYLLNEVKHGEYIVREGDTLNDIATKFNTTKRLIMLDNFLNEEVTPNMVLHVNVYSVLHVVKLNESLEDIASFYGVSKEEILNKNKTSFIHPYMKLVIK